MRRHSKALSYSPKHLSRLCFFPRILVCPCGLQLRSFAPGGSRITLFPQSMDSPAFYSDSLQVNLNPLKCEKDNKCENWKWCWLSIFPYLQDWVFSLLVWCFKNKVACQNPSIHLKPCFPIIVYVPLMSVCVPNVFILISMLNILCMDYIFFHFVLTESKKQQDIHLNIRQNKL